MGISCEVISVPSSYKGLVESPVGNQSPNVTRPMEDSDDGDGLTGMRVVDCVGPEEGHAYAWRDERACWLAFGEGQNFFAGGLRLGNQAVRRVLAGILRYIGPDFRQVGFCVVGQEERAANSFLPRSAMRCALNSWTRPAATSASPLSISCLSVASSSSIS